MDRIRTLAEKLAEAGFRNVLGKIEHPGFDPAGMGIVRGWPRTWDANNGVIVVYDDAGEPWVRPARLGEFNPYRFGLFQGARGAYVPHSNDGGREIRKLFPGCY